MRATLERAGGEPNAPGVHGDESDKTGPTGLACNVAEGCWYSPTVVRERYETGVLHSRTVELVVATLINPPFNGAAVTGLTFEHESCVHILPYFKVVHSREAQHTTDYMDLPTLCSNRWVCSSAAFAICIGQYYRDLALSQANEARRVS